MREFNYKRAWRQYIKPKFNKLSPAVMSAYKATEAVVDKLEQGPNASPYVQGEGLTPELKGLFNAVSAKELAKASEIIYHYGYLSPEGTAQKAGLYWKFQSLAYASLMDREEDVSEIRYKAKTRMSKALNRFMDHKPGSNYENDEVIGKILSGNRSLGKDVVTMIDVRNINFRPDVFCIGQRHFGSGSMYVDPNIAPCAACGQPYSEHTSEKVMVVRVLSEDKSLVGQTLKEILKACAKIGVKLDGFVQIKKA